MNEYISNICIRSTKSCMTLSTEHRLLFKINLIYYAFYRFHRKVKFDAELFCIILTKQNIRTYEDVCIFTLMVSKYNASQ